MLYFLIIFYINKSICVDFIINKYVIGRLEFESCVLKFWGDVVRFLNCVGKW